ncbi:DMT family transporter [Chryseobacterium salipaludis]|uniref:DMT family transporter n=1 Tax=Chryseobacterium TaxID=59732 RepID=UPI001FF349F1|nr:MULTISPECIES: EamA family transporter [Chryseobacterium]MCJ8498059.1 DMT family transporter [Chryseobacterium salipaludis]MCX3296742.1 EamA family transporter [Planobacterium sp. JC490]
MKQFVHNKYFLLIFIALIWGSSFILIKKILPVFDPYQIGAFRGGLSGLLLSFIGWPALKRMSRKDIFWIALSGLFGNFLVVFIFPIAQQGVSSSLAGIINALDPIFTLILGAMLFGIRNKAIQYAGAVIGFIGAIILVYSSNSGTGESHLYYTILLVIGSALYAVAALIIEKKLPHIKSTDISTGIYTIWMVPSLLILGFSGFFTDIDYSHNETVVALGYLVFLTVISTTLVMFLFFKLVQDTSAVFVSTISLLLPVVAVIWGILDKEKFTVWYAIGGLLILLSVYLIREKNNKSFDGE